MQSDVNYPLNVQFRYEEQPLLWQLNDIYTESECNNFIKFIESSQPTIATNNSMYRDQDRVILDDSIKADELFQKIKHSLPKEIEGFKLSRLNERLRFYRYMKGQKFSPHMDHWYQPNENEVSLFSVLAYFNGNFSGGETKFMEQIEATVIPEPGKVAIFQHKIRHEGCEVLNGIKYAVRTDVIYTKC